jgi:hypothetical protein
MTDPLTGVGPAFRGAFQFFGEGDVPMASACELLDRLETGLDNRLASDHFRRWLTVQARFHHYSFGNILLTATQYPTATRVAAFTPGGSLAGPSRRASMAS